MFTAKSPVVPKVIFKLLPESGVIPKAPEAVMMEGVESEVLAEAVVNFPSAGVVAPTVPFNAADTAVKDGLDVEVNAWLIPVKYEL